MKTRLGAALAASVILLTASGSEAQTTSGFNVLSTFNFIQDIGLNDGGLRSGVSDNVGINIAPFGAGTTVTACQFPSCQGGLQPPVPYFFSPANPNEYVTALPLSPSSYIGAWTFSLTNPTINGGSPVIASTTNPLATLPLPTQPLVTTTPPPFVSNVLLSPGGPGGTMPTLSWTVPNGYKPDAQSLYIYDKSHQTPHGLAPLVYINNNIGLQPTWTAPAGLFGGPGGLSLSDNYMISIQLDQTNPTLPTPENIEGRSRTFVNFNVSSVTSPVYVPIITANGAYQFDISVATGQVYPIDPVAATGFKYAIGAGNPNFATVELPNLQGSEPYTITWDNGKETEQVLGGVLFSFLPTDSGGVSAFTVLGIDPAAGVDPTSGVDFVTDLTFVGNGSFSGTMTPITGIPEHSTWAMMLLGFAGLGFLGYRRAVKAPIAA